MYIVFMPFDWTRALSPVCLLSFHNLMNFCMPKLLFSSPGPKVQVNYCHHLAFVVCRPLSSFFFETTGPIGTKLSRNVPWMVRYKFSVFRSSRIFNMAARANNMLWLAEISSLKLMNGLNPNCKWMIIGMSFTKFLFFMPIGNPRWPPPQNID